MDAMGKSWTEIKNLVDNDGFFLRFIEEATVYHLSAFDDLFVVVFDLFKIPSDTADLLDCTGSDKRH